MNNGTIYGKHWCTTPKCERKGCSDALKQVREAVRKGARFNRHGFLIPESVR